jgi:tetratricopeptide (TPR) repeat protein
MLMLMAAVAVWAQSAPKWAKKARKSIVSVMTYGKDGTLMKSGTGFYVDGSGTAVADYSLFKGAYSAVVADAAGKKNAVARIAGADDPYGVVRFTTDAAKPATLQLAKTAPVKGESLWVLDFSKEKAAACPTAVVEDIVTVHDSCAYYTLSLAFDAKYTGCPVFNGKGELIGTLQPSASGKSYALDAKFLQSLSIKAIQTKSENLALDNSNIRKALPGSQEEALVYLYFKSHTLNNDDYMDLANLFVSTYPDNAEGYYRRAVPLVDLRRFDDADKDLKEYIRLSADKAKAHANVAQAISNKIVYQPDTVYAPWTFDAAIEHLDAAIGIDPKIDYKYKKGQMLMAKKDYDGAYELYNTINESAERTPASFYAASLALEGRGDSVSTQIAMMDSAIALFSDPMPAEAASYVLHRGMLHDKAGAYRAAVVDYNKFCYLSNNQVAPRFYYDRARIETKARMYQQAIDDINMALSAEPRNTEYLTEKCALLLRVNMLDESIETARQCIAVDAESVDAYRMLGYALLQKGDKAGALENLNRAISLGDEGAKEIVTKYMK